MENLITTAQVAAPIFAAIALGILARRKHLMTPEGVQGMQQFVMQFGLPCVVFNSLWSASLGVEALTSMAMVVPVMLLGTLWAFRARKKQFPYRNLPQLFCAQETGMLGIPLFIILFGADQAYRMGVLDLAQAVTAYPVIAILSANTGENPTPASICKKVLTSPLLLASALALTLNITGFAGKLDSSGIGGILTACTAFLGQPISAMMMFSVGYNLSMEKGSRSAIFRISAIHLGVQILACAIIQLILCLVPGVDSLTRWAVAVYFTLPGSYLAPSLGRSQEDFTVASGVCSVLTVVCLVAFCGIAAFVGNAH